MMFQITLTNVLVYFSTFYLLIYLSFCLYAKRILKADLMPFSYIIFLYMFVGVFSEQFGDSLYSVVIGEPFWEYRLYPIYGGHTSLISPLLWGLFGGYVYFRNEAFSINVTTRSHLALTLMALEPAGIEMAANVPYYLLFGDYIFYYIPSDLGHFTSVATVPFYMGMTIIINRMIRKQKEVNYSNTRASIGVFIFSVITLVYV